MTYDKILKGSACRVPDRNHCHGYFISKNFVRNLADDCHYLWNHCLSFYHAMGGSIYLQHWYQVSKSEMKLYEKLRVKKWKNCMPTYNPSLFDPRQHTWEEIAQVTCQAELGHETIVVLSFVPILAGHWLGGYPAFIITSILAAMFDMMFVIMQRYNRQRILKLIK